LLGHHIKNWGLSVKLKIGDDEIEMLDSLNKDDIKDYVENLLVTEYDINDLTIKVFKNEFDIVALIENIGIDKINSEFKHQEKDLLLIERQENI
jgi:hypothetical protein